MVALSVLLMDFNSSPAMHCTNLYFPHVTVFHSYLFYNRLAYRAGVTAGISPPASSGFLSGLGTAFATGALHNLSKGAVLQEETALLISIGAVTKPSVSTQISVLRRLLNGEGEGDLGKAFKKIVKVRPFTSSRLHRHSRLLSG